MQRYGWQARQAKLSNNSNTSGDANSLNNVQQSSAISDIFVNLDSNSESKGADVGVSRVSRGSSELSELERKGKITKISSIS